MTALMIRRNEDRLSRWVCFVVAGQDYGLPIERVQEVLRDTAVEPVPGTQPVVLGVINLRGNVVTVLDLRIRMGISASDAAVPVADADRRIIVLELGGELFGLAVDAVAEVLKLADAAIKPSPQVGDAGAMPRAAGLVSRDQRLLTLIEPESLIEGLRFLA